MKKIKGNQSAVIQERTVTMNSIGEEVETWTDSVSLKGFLDYTGGQAQIREYDTKLEESTHIFFCNYKELSVDARNTRMVIGTRVYEILEIDNPMGMNEHLEIYLKYIGVA